MSDVSSLYTQQTGNGQALSTNGKSAAALASETPGMAGGFLDMLLATLLPAAVPATTPTTTVTSDESALTSAPDTLYTQVAEPLSADLLDAGQPEDSVVAVITPTETPFTSVIDTLNPTLTKGAQLPADQTPISLYPTAPTDDAPVTPILDARLRAQLAALDPVRSDTPETVNPATLNAIVVGGEQPAEEPQTSVAPFQLTTDIQETNEPTNDLAARLNAMTIGADEDQRKNGRPGNPVDLIRGLNLTPANDDGYNPNITTQTPVQGGAVTPMATTTTLKPETSDMIDDMGKADDNALFQVDLSMIDPDQLSPTSSHATVPTIIASGIKTALAAATGASGHAAVQAVAMHLQQLAQNRDTKSLTLQLNPPELGKMQIKMTYGRDKSVKADILIEKSDTFNLMKNDADALKDALSNAGLRADAGSLNFSLADQGTFTNQQSPNESFGLNGTGSNSNTTDDISAIEIKASEEWSVDPHTGIVRYNIIV